MIFCFVLVIEILNFVTLRMTTCCCKNFSWSCQSAWNWNYIYTGLRRIALQLIRLNFMLWNVSVQMNILLVQHRES